MTESELLRLWHLLSCFQVSQGSFWSRSLPREGTMILSKAEPHCYGERVQNVQMAKPARAQSSTGSSLPSSCLSVPLLFSAQNTPPPIKILPLKGSPQTPASFSGWLLHCWEPRPTTHSLSDIALNVFSIVMTGCLYHFPTQFQNSSNGKDRVLFACAPPEWELTHTLHVCAYHLLAKSPSGSLHLVVVCVSERE